MSWNKPPFPAAASARSPNKIFILELFVHWCRSKLGRAYQSEDSRWGRHETQPILNENMSYKIKPHVILRNLFFNYSDERVPNINMVLFLNKDSQYFDLLFWTKLNRNVK